MNYQISTTFCTPDPFIKDWETDSNWVVTEIKPGNQSSKFFGLQIHSKISKLGNSFFGLRDPQPNVYSFVGETEESHIYFLYDQVIESHMQKLFKCIQDRLREETKKVLVNFIEHFNIIMCWIKPIALLYWEDNQTLKINIWISLIFNGEKNINLHKKKLWHIENSSFIL